MPTVDADMDIFPAGAPGPCPGGGPAGCSAGCGPRDTVTDGPEAAELLDVDVEKLAEFGALTAAHRRGRLEAFQSAQAPPLQHPAAGDGRDARGGSDLLARQALTAQGSIFFGPPVAVSARRR